MKAIATHSVADHIIDDEFIVSPNSKNNFIEANTLKVDIKHLKEDCVIPVFSKDNETTISHYQFIDKSLETVKKMFPNFEVSEPDIRVSHVIKGRTPSAIGKPVKDLLPHEKTIYYERCAFVIELHQAREIVNGNTLTLSIGGVRALNQDNLYSKKSVEKFKIFIGYQNKVCTNLCISTDGFLSDLRITSVNEIEEGFVKLANQYDRSNHISTMQRMKDYTINETQFAHLIGKSKMFQHLEKNEQKQIFPILLNDTQINSAVKDYFNCPNFSRDKYGNISLWDLYNIFTEANKSSYIDSNLERNVNAYEFVKFIGKTLQHNSDNWYLPS